MSKITANIVLALLKLVLKALERAVALSLSVLDLIDDGVLNNSYERPAWFDKLDSVILVLKRTVEVVSNTYDEIEDSTVERSSESEPQTDTGHA